MQQMQKRIIQRAVDNHVFNGVNVASAVNRLSNTPGIWQPQWQPSDQAQLPC